MSIIEIISKFSHTEAVIALLVVVSILCITCTVFYIKILYMRRKESYKIRCLLEVISSLQKGFPQNSETFMDMDMYMLRSDHEKMMQLLLEQMDNTTATYNDFLDLLKKSFDEGKFDPDNHVSRQDLVLVINSLRSRP